MNVDRRKFLKGLAAILVPVSPLPESKVLDILNDESSPVRLNELSLEEIFEAASDFKIFNRPIKVDGRHFFNPSSFSKVINTSGILRVEILKKLEALELSPEILRTNKDALLNQIACSEETNIHTDTIAKMLDITPEYPGRSYADIAKIIEQRTLRYIEDTLKHDGGKAVVSEGMRLLSRSHLEIFLKKYGEAIPKDIKDSIESEMKQWRLEPAGGSGVLGTGYYFRVVVSDTVSLTDKESVAKKAITLCERKLRKSLFNTSKSDIKPSKIGSEYWLHTDSKSVAAILQEDCVSQEQSAHVSRT